MYTEIMRGSNGTGIDCYSFDCVWHLAVRARVRYNDKIRTAKLNRIPPTVWTHNGHITVNKKNQKVVIMLDEDSNEYVARAIK
jgi:hypothetical protein